MRLDSADRWAESSTGNQHRGLSWSVWVKAVMRTVALGHKWLWAILVARHIMVSVCGLRLWPPSVASVCGLRLWPPSVASVCGLYLWPVCGLRLWPPSVASVCGLYLWPVCGLRLWPVCGLRLWPLSVACLWPLSVACLWPLSVASVCGLCLWPLSVASVCGLCLWPLSVASVCGLCLWPLSPSLWKTQKQNPHKHQQWYFPQIKLWPSGLSAHLTVSLSWSLSVSTGGLFLKK